MTRGEFIASSKSNRIILVLGDCTPAGPHSVPTRLCTTKRHQAAKQAAPAAHNRAHALQIVLTQHV